jgi:hypothetical protein
MLLLRLLGGLAHWFLCLRFLPSLTVRDAIVVHVITNASAGNVRDILVSYRYYGICIRFVVHLLPYL